MPSSLVAVVMAALAAVLLLSAAAKLRPGEGSETLRSLEALKVPSALRRLWFARALPFGELAVAGGLLLAPHPLSPVAGVAAVLLFGAFLVVVALSVRRRDQASCSCFGSRAAQPVGSRTVLRNAVLAAGSLVVLGASATGSPGVIWAMVDAGPGGWSVVAALVVAAAFVVLGATTVAGPDPAGRPGAGGGAPRPRRRDGEAWPTPDLEVTDAAGRSVQLVSLAVERPALLLLVSPGCAPCAEAMRSVVDWQERFGDAVAVKLLTSATPEEFAHSYPHPPAPMHFGYRSLMSAAGIDGVPSALLLGIDRTVAGGPARGLEQVQQFAEAIASVLPERGDDALAARTSRGADHVHH